MSSEVKAGQVWTRCDGDTDFGVRKREVLSVEDGIAVVRTMMSGRATHVRVKNGRLPGHKLLSAPPDPDVVLVELSREEARALEHACLGSFYQPGRRAALTKVRKALARTEKGIQ